mmetsp:Transcript_3014/g.3183  ORF Transcript_3014/g.3183 Transcript_3014/m.3183 type:complete len:114 (+) Transcript_3014:345-686(+)
MALSKSNIEENKREAVQLLRSLLQNPEYTRDAFYNLSLTLYSLGNYEQARQYSEELLRQEPDNIQLEELHQAVLFKHKERMKSNENAATIGVSVGVGVLAAAMYILLKSSSKK